MLSMIIGYVFTAVYIILFFGLVGSIVLSRKRILGVFKGKVDRVSLLALLVIVLFFAVFSLLYVHPAERQTLLS